MVPFGRKAPRRAHMRCIVRECRTCRLSQKSEDESAQHSSSRRTSGSNGRPACSPSRPTTVQAMSYALFSWSSPSYANVPFPAPATVPTVAAVEANAAPIPLMRAGMPSKNIILFSFLCVTSCISIDGRAFPSFPTKKSSTPKTFHSPN